ncbi:MAG: hypothetical protein DRH24_12335 [Deltaproteobacteria bacterium]|nr:MAG: hypothetical protein DRH24_12335 [Deltaproteobacteria bacterium]
MLLFRINFIEILDSTVDTVKERFTKTFDFGLPGRPMLSGNSNTLILHESGAFIWKALKGEVIVYYYEPLITQQMEASGSPFG